MAPNSLNSHNGAGRTALSPPASSSVDYCWNRWALRRRLKEQRVVSGVLRSAGRLFHVRGPLMAKLHWPVAVRARGTSRVPDAMQRSCWRPCTDWAGRHTQVSQITRGCIVQGLPHKHRRLVDDSLAHCKPVQANKNWRDVFVAMSPGNQAGCGVLHRPESPKIISDLGQNRVAVVQSTTNEGLDKGTCRLGRLSLVISTQWLIIQYYCYWITLECRYLHLRLCLKQCQHLHPLADRRISAESGLPAHCNAPNRNKQIHTLHQLQHASKFAKKARFSHIIISQAFRASTRMLSAFLTHYNFSTIEVRVKHRISAANIPWRFLLKLKGKVYATCVRSCLMHGSETWPMKVEHEVTLNHTEMIKWVKLNERKKSEERREPLVLKPTVRMMIKKMVWTCWTKRW